MGRAAGKKSNLPRQPIPGTPEGDDIGLSERQDPAGSPIPGLTGNILNYPTVEQRPAVPDGEFGEYRGIMAHGVPNASETTEQRALMERDGTLARQHRPPGPPQSATPRQRPTPIPVYLTTLDGGPEAYISASPRNFTVPNNTTDPVRLCGRNPKRNRIGLLNEDTATNVRFAVRPSDLTNGGGALLPWPVSTYQWFETQDELYAWTVSSTLSVIVSVIEEFDEVL
jgi:hypothetical protein